MSMGGDLNGVLVETMITHVDCWDDKRSGGLIPLSLPFISRRFKVTNLFYTVVCRNSMRGDVDRLKKGTGGTGPGLSSLLPSVRAQNASHTFGSSLRLHL